MVQSVQIISYDILNKIYEYDYICFIIYIKENNDTNDIILILYGAIFVHALIYT